MRILPVRASVLSAFSRKRQLWTNKTSPGDGERLPSKKANDHAIFGRAGVDAAVRQQQAGREKPLSSPPASRWSPGSECRRTASAPVLLPWRKCGGAAGGGKEMRLRA